MKTLLGTVAAAALVLGISGAAYAHEHHDGDDVKTGTDVAVALQSNESEHNLAISLGSKAKNDISGSFGTASGAFNVGQNAGANSVVSNNTAVAAMTSSAAPGVTVALALQGNEAERDFAFSLGSHAKDTISSSFNSARGAFNVGQNSGANSVVANDLAVASMTNGTSLSSTGLSLAVAASGAESERNLAVGICDTASNSISGSFAGANGAFNISQNAGANSVVQGTMAVGALTH